MRIYKVPMGQLYSYLSSVIKQCRIKLHFRLEMCNMTLENSSIKTLNYFMKSLYVSTETIPPPPSV